MKVLNIIIAILVGMIIASYYGGQYYTKNYNELWGNYGYQQNQSTNSKY